MLTVTGVSTHWTLLSSMRISRALSHSSLTSCVVMSSQLRSFSICLSRSEDILLLLLLLWGCVGCWTVVFASCAVFEGRTAGNEGKRSKTESNKKTATKRNQNSRQHNTSQDKTQASQDTTQGTRMSYQPPWETNPVAVPFGQQSPAVQPPSSASSAQPFILAPLPPRPTTPKPTLCLSPLLFSLLWPAVSQEALSGTETRIKNKDD